MSDSKQKIAKKVIDWDTIGQFIKILLDLFTVIRSEFVAAEIGIKIIPWLAGEGKEVLSKALVSLSEKFWESQLVRTTPNKNIIFVNLDLAPTLPFDVAYVTENPCSGWGWVKVEKRADDLFVSGRKVPPHIAPWTDVAEIRRALTEDLAGESALHPNILDALLQQRHLVPGEFRWEDRRVSISFGAVKFSTPYGGTCIRVLFSLRSGEFQAGNVWLDESQKGKDGVQALGLKG